MIEGKCTFPPSVAINIVLHFNICRRIYLLRPELLLTKYIAGKRNFFNLKSAWVPNVICRTNKLASVLSCIFHFTWYAKGFAVIIK